MIITPWIDIILYALVVYLLEYWFYKIKKIDIFEWETKYVIINLWIDLIFLILIWILYYWKDYIFPYWLNWFWYTIIVSIVVEIAVIFLYWFLNNKK